MANINAVKTLTISGASSLKVISAPPSHGLETEDIDVSDFSNAERMENVARSQKKESDISLLLEYDGVLASVGASATLAVEVTKNDGTLLSASTTGYIRSAVPQEIAIDGERRLLQSVVFAADGSNTTTTT